MPVQLVILVLFLKPGHEGLAHVSGQPVAPSKCIRHAVKRLRQLVKGQKGGKWDTPETGLNVSLELLHAVLRTGPPLPFKACWLHD